MCTHFHTLIHICTHVCILTQKCICVHTLTITLSSVEWNHLGSFPGLLSLSRALEVPILLSRLGVEAGPAVAQDGRKGWWVSGDTHLEASARYGCPHTHATPSPRQPSRKTPSEGIGALQDGNAKAKRTLPRGGHLPWEVGESDWVPTTLSAPVLEDNGKPLCFDCACQ